MKKILALFVPVAALAFVGCHPSTSLGTVTIGTTTFTVTSEGSNQAGQNNNYAVKPTDNAGITSVTAGVGADATAATTACDYDSADGDYDCNVPLPNPIPAGAQLWISVVTSSGTTSGSIALPAS